MSARKLLLNLLMIFVLIPTSLGAVFCTLMFALFALPAHSSIANPLIGSTLIVVGWFGIISLWRLYIHFISTNYAPANSFYYWLGLFFGVAASFDLIISTAGSPFINTLIFGWPLIAAMVFSILLLMSAKRAPQLS
jgi:hypothetical protein